MADVTLVSGDDAPDLDGLLAYDDGSGPIDLTGATVLFQMRLPADRRYTVNAAATIVSPAGGTVRYSWGPNDLNVPGTYQTQWQVTWPGGRQQTSNPPNLVEVRRQ